MKCQQCGKNEATAHYTEIINGQKKEWHLCAQCAKQASENGKLSGFHQMFADGAPSFWNTAGSLWGDLLGATVGAQDETTCTCGMTESKLRRGGKAGCAKCYETFSAVLTPYIQKLHGAVQHIGATPGGAPAVEENPVDTLKKQLADAIAKEEFEQAAHIRDEIRRLEAN